MTTTVDPAAVRHAIVHALPAETSLHGGVPSPRHVYVPPAHAKALRLDASLVIGARGVGKTFWSAALASEDLRTMLGRSFAELADVDVHAGFAERQDLDSFPSADLFGVLVRDQDDAYDVWRAVIARWLAATTGSTIPTSSWPATLSWVRSESEAFGRLLEKADAAYGATGRHGLIVFDALDRTSRDWTSMDAIVRELLRLVLTLKPFERLHAKVFLREDQFEGRPVKDFADASKVLASRVELTWAPNDLHGLLWQYLCNALGPDGGLLRSVFEANVPEPLTETGMGAWALPDRVKRDPVMQRALFSAIAGHWMGTGPRRGMTYTWSVSHLADGRGRTTPRSFLAAIRAAAEDSLERYPDHEHALHYESVKRGVQKASEIRVDELAETYPWMRDLMAPLAGMNVPADQNAVVARWTERFGDRFASPASDRLPPEHAEMGWRGILDDLRSLGIIERMRDGRLNMPDLYRVGFGLGRKGGVKPLATVGSS